MWGHKRWQRSFAQAVVQCEAASWLLFAWLVLRVAPFQWLVGFLERPVAQPEVQGEIRERTRRAVSAAISQASQWFPMPMVCFPRAIAAQIMLRRRRIATVLYYGAATLPDKGLTAHVWVQDGPHGVVGQYEAPGYLVLARYPSTSQPEPQRPG